VVNTTDTQLATAAASDSVVTADNVQLTNVCIVVLHCIVIVMVWYGISIPYWRWRYSVIQQYKHCTL